MAINRIALIFDDRIRPDTTGGHVHRALAGLVEVVHFQPDQCHSIRASGFDLYLSIDDDSEHRLPDGLRPRAYWAIDTHLNFPARFDRSVPCDAVFAAQRDGAERLRQAGIDSAAWLPLACDPEIHRRRDVTKDFDVSFVGNVFPGPRAELLELLKSRYRRHFAGKVYLDDMARIYSASRVVFNRSIRNDVNMRVFEAVACGSLLVTNDLAANGQDELFQDGVHLATYRDADELLAKIAYYLEHEDERAAIAAAGRAEALARHTYRHRMERLLAEVETRLARTVAAPGLGPSGSGGASSRRDEEQWMARQDVHSGFDAPAPACEGHPHPSPLPEGEGASLFSDRDERRGKPMFIETHTSPLPEGEGASFFSERDERRGKPMFIETQDFISPASPSRDREEPLAPRIGVERMGGPGAAPSTEGARAGLTSIIVPCCNQLEFTRHCLRALIRHTRQPWELIVIDNGSTDGTSAYLGGVQDISAVPVTVFTNARNLGFPAAVNQGLKIARGEFLVLLNNDAVVTDGWLDQLIALTHADPTIGLTGPMTK